MRETVFIVRTGSANLASVRAAVARLGFEAVLTERAEDVLGARRLIVPGVGALGAAMGALERAGLVGALRERIGRGGATLCVCLGMQLLLEGSEESPGVAGLGVAAGRAGRFGGAGLRVPQLGWNWVEPEAGCGLVEPGWAYYANSFRLAARPTGWSVAWTEYGGRFVGAMQRGAVLACQFHPELSGAWGARLLERWLKNAETGAAGGGGRVGTGVLPPRVIACLDMRDGRVVKGVRFQNLREAGDPAALAGAYAEQGADELVVLDVSATAEGRRAALETVRRVRRAIDVPLTVGGGVRSEEDAAALLEAGADKVGVNTAAVERPEILSRLAERFGCQAVVLAVDGRRKGQMVKGAEGQRGDGAAGQGQSGGGWEVVTRAGTVGTGMDAVAWVRRGVELGAGEILLTSWDRDGTGHGYDLELTEAVSGAASVPVIASGGAATPEHLGEALRHGASAVLAASIFHDGVWTVGGIKARLDAMGIKMRGTRVERGGGVLSG
jgi:imidazole glycerol phosphate synthase glutamine amidotransferase subunit